MYVCGSSVRISRYGCTYDDRGIAARRHSNCAHRDGTATRKPSTESAPEFVTSVVGVTARVSYSTFDAIHRPSNVATTTYII